MTDTINATYDPERNLFTVRTLAGETMNLTHEEIIDLSTMTGYAIDLNDYELGHTEAAFREALGE